MDATRETPALEEAFEELKALLARPDDDLQAPAPGVSAWSPAQHAEHMLIAVRRMFAAIGALQTGEGEAVRPKGKPTVIGRLVLRAGHIPRGKADAPEGTEPSPAVDLEAVRESYARARARFDELAPSAGTFVDLPGVVDHPILAGFSASQWWRFARIHTEHHLRIVRDIHAAR